MLDGTNGFIVEGTATDPSFGSAISHAGDFNGDGIDDIIIGFPGAIPDNEFAAGEVYILFGQAGNGFEATIDPQLLDGSNGIRIKGKDIYDFAGASVIGAGDVNGDGYDDVVIGAFGAGDNNPDFNSRVLDGESYIVFGRPSVNEIWSTDDDVLSISVSDLHPNAAGIDSQTVMIDILNANDAPIINGTLVNQTVIEGDNLSYSLAGLFIDPDADDQVRITAKTGNGAPLPSWLNFDASTLVLSGIPGADDVGLESIVVTATDLSGQSVSSGFSIQVLDIDPVSVGGTSGDDIMYGGIQGDTLRGGGGNDALYGNSGNDVLKGSSGNDFLSGGAGNDRLEGGRHDDTYLFGYGDDQDVINDSHGNDQLLFSEGVNPEDIWLSKTGNDLQVQLVGSYDQVTIDNWFKGKNGSNQIEQFQSDDGSVLLNNQVDQLIQAMATFSEDTGMGWLDAVQQRPDEVNTVLAGVWQG